MTDESDVDNGQRYLARRTAIFEVVSSLLEQADVLTEDKRILEQDREELRVGILMLNDGVQNFFKCSEALMLEVEVLVPALDHLTNCLYAVLGGSALTFRHVDLSDSRKKEILRRSTEAGSSARTASKEREAEKVRDIIERAERTSDGQIKNIGRVKQLVATRLEKTDIDYKTFKGYVAVIDGSGKTDDPPTKE